MSADLKDRETLDDTDLDDPFDIYFTPYHHDRPALPRKAAELGVEGFEPIVWAAWVVEPRLAVVTAVLAERGEHRMRFEVPRPTTLRCGDRFTYSVPWRVIDRMGSGQA